MPKIYAKYSPEVIVKMRKQAEEEERRKKESEATLADRLWPDAPTQNYAPAKSSSPAYQTNVARQSPVNESQKSNQMSETEARIAEDRRLMDSLWPDTSMQGQNTKAESKPSSLGGNSLASSSSNQTGFGAQPQENKSGMGRAGVVQFSQEELQRKAVAYNQAIIEFEKLGVKVEKQNYFPGAVGTVHKVVPDILAAAKYFNVSPEVVAACMLDENTSVKRRIAYDPVQDSLFKRHLGKTNKEMEQDASNNRITQQERELNDPYTWDLGPYNINITVAHNLFKQHVLNSDMPDNPIRNITLKNLNSNADVETKWQSFINNCLLSNKGGAYLTAAVLQNESGILDPYVKGLSREGQEAVLVTAFKQGGVNLIKKFLERKEKEPNSIDHIRAGEGMLMLYNMQTIQRILYGEPAAKIPPRYR